MPSDRAIAQEVDSGLRPFVRHSTRPDDEQSQQVTLYVLTNLTDLEALKRESDPQSGPTFAVVAASIKLPEELFRYQWVDYRQRSAEQIGRLAELLEFGEGRVSYSRTVVPEALQRVVVPRGIYFVVNAMRSLSVFALGAGLYLLLLPLFAQGGSWLGLPLAILGSALVMLADKLSARGIASTYFLGVYSLLWALAVVLNLGGVLWVLVRFYSVDPYTGEPTILSQLYLTVLMLVPFAVVLFYRELIERWLPVRVQQRPVRLPLQPSLPSIRWLDIAFGTLVVLLLLLANSTLKN